jgi:HD domain
MVRAAQRSGRRSIDSGQLLLISIAGLVVIVTVTQAVADGLVHPDTAVIFGVLVALGELARMAMPGDREVAPIGTAGALGYALLLRVGDQPAGHSPSQVVAVTTAGMLIGALPHIAVGRSPHVDAMARRLLTVAVAAFAFRLIDDHPPHRGDWPMVLSLMAIVVTIASAVDVVAAAVIRAEAVRARLGIALADEVRVKTALCAASGTTGMLIAVATSVMGLTALLVFTAPILVTQFAFRRYTGIVGTYLQTVRALSRVTEVGGYVETGHSRRVAELSVAMGRELGMSEPELLDLEYAAFMHDIGQLSLGDPIPGGATVLASPSEQRRIAEFGAGVIEQTGVLPRVAEIVRRQSDSYRVAQPPPEADGRTEPAMTAPPLGSRIIKVANAYDDLVGDSVDRDRAVAVLERLRLDSASEYDPAVIESLARVIGRGALLRR